MSSELFNRNTTAIIYGLQAAAIQRMLDFDFICKRERPSVSAIVNPSGDGMHKAFFGGKEVFIPVYKSIADAASRHPECDMLVNFASFRSAFDTTVEALEENTIRTVAVIAEGVPERKTKELIQLAKAKQKTIIGPATVGGLTGGAFKIGNTGGAMDALIDAKLYRSGSVGFASKSGGMSNEMFNVISQNTDGIYEGIAVGGDKFPGSTLLDHVLRFQAIDAVKMIVVLGELGGTEEYDIAGALKEKKVTKPLVAWVTGTCAAVFPTEVQFGHAGAKSGVLKESAQEKNKALKEAGAIVPQSFDDFGDAIKKTFDKLNAEGKIPKQQEYSLPAIPEDYAAAVKAGRIRKPSSFVCTISDDRGEEVTYCGKPLSEIIQENGGIGEAISLLWLKKKLPRYATQFMEMVVVITADHGPCVSGAHNTIVASRAGKDLISSLCSGLLTIGPRFGGAIDDAARYFSSAVEKGTASKAFVEEMKEKGILIPGIGHRIKSLQNPDKRVELLKAYARKNFPSTRHLDFALEVEKITTSKKANLILNVDGCIAALFLDLFESANAFSKQEVSELLDIGFLNGFFALGRTIGLVGHAIDQKRMKQGLYRHPWDDVLFTG